VIIYTAKVFIISREPKDTTENEKRPFHNGRSSIGLMVDASSW